MKAGWCRLFGVMIAVRMGGFALAAESSATAWRPLLDERLSQWEIFIGVPHGSLGLPTVPAESDGMKGRPLGLRPLADNEGVFSVRMENDEPVVCVSGRIYGGLTTKESFSNYHLRAQFKWGGRKWAPRLTQRRDSGILYHASGEHGAFWKVWKRSIEFQIEETNMGDLYALAGAAAEVPVVPILPAGKFFRYDPAGKVERIVTGDGVPIFTARHAAGSFERPPGEWNTLEILALGDTAVHVVNGRVVLVARHLVTLASARAPQPLTSGQVQLQSEGAEAFYRRVELRPMAAFPEEVRSQLPADFRPGR